MPVGVKEMNAPGTVRAKARETTNPTAIPDAIVEATVRPTVFLTRTYAGTPRTAAATAATGRPPTRIRPKRMRLLIGTFKFEESVKAISRVANAA
jgi:hypothetical protein